MDLNARTGMGGWIERKAAGAYGCNELNVKGERLLFHATESKLAVRNTYYATPAMGIAQLRAQPRKGPVQA